jgi:hypothetical protein
VIGHLAGLLADPSASPCSAAALLDLLPAKSDKGAAYDLKKLSDQQLDQLNHLTSIATGEPPELTQPPELTDADYAFVKVLAELRPRCGPSYRPGRELPTIEAIGAVRDALDILLIRAGVELDDVAVVGPREGRHEKMLVQLEVGDLVLPAAERRFFDLPGLLSRPFLPDASDGIQRIGHVEGPAEPVKRPQVENAPATAARARRGHRRTGHRTPTTLWRSIETFTPWLRAC